jgi:hypothetical protein
MGPIIYGVLLLEIVLAGFHEMAKLEIFKFLNKPCLGEENIWRMRVTGCFIKFHREESRNLHVLPVVTPTEFLEKLNVSHRRPTDKNSTLWIYLSTL